MAQEIDERQCLAKINETATTLMDKKLILDARDKLLRLKQDRRTDLATAVAVVGTCLDMCPEQERYFRIETNCVESYEMNSDGTPDETRMVKEYRRSGADQKEPLSHELRPIDVLQRTMNYLCLEIIDSNFTSKGDWFDFIWGRTRSIRKDITQQLLINNDSVDLIEKCARFHIFCAYYLCEEELRNFDPKINEENLHNCLQTLKEFYFDLSTKSIYCPNESEFRTYDILLNLRNRETLSELKHYRKEIRDSPDVCFAVKIYQAYHSRNYIKFFQYARQANFLMSCILNNYFNPFRIDMLNIMRNAYTIPTKNKNNEVPYPVENLMYLFAFDDFDELSHFCDKADLNYNTESIFLLRSPSIPQIDLKRRSSLLVQDKLQTSPGRVILKVSEDVNAVILPVHSSFDHNNRLIFDASSLSSTNATATVSDNKAVISSQNFDMNNEPSVKFPLFNSKPEKVFPKAPSSFSFLEQAKIAEPAKITFPPSTSAPPPKYGSNGSFFKFTNPIPVSNSLNNNVNSSFIYNLKNKTIVPDIPNSNNLFDLKTSQEAIPIAAPVKPKIDIRSISQKMSPKVLDELMSTLIRDQCQKTLSKAKEVKILANSQAQSLFNGLLTNIVQNLAFEVIENKKKKKQAVLNCSQSIVQQLIMHVAKTTIKDTYVDIRTRHKKNRINALSNQLYEMLFENVLYKLIHQVIVNETEARDNAIRNWRRMFLMRKFWHKWRKFYLDHKKFKFYRDTFPAAPISHVDDRDLHEMNRTAMDSSYIKSYGDLRRKLTYSKYKDTIELNHYLKEKLNNRIQNNRSELDCLKRAYYLESKYFKLWLNKVRIRKRNFIRANFPAAPLSSNGQPQPSYPEHRFRSEFTIIDNPIQNATSSIRRNLIQKLNCDFDSTISMIKRKLDQRERERLEKESLEPMRKAAKHYN